MYVAVHFVASLLGHVAKRGKARQEETSGVQIFMRDVMRIMTHKRFLLGLQTWIKYFMAGIHDIVMR